MIFPSHPRTSGQVARTQTAPPAQASGRYRSLPPRRPPDQPSAPSRPDPPARPRPGPSPSGLASPFALARSSQPSGARSSRGRIARVGGGCMSVRPPRGASRLETSGRGRRGRCHALGPPRGRCRAAPLRSPPPSGGGGMGGGRFSCRRARTEASQLERLPLACLRGSRVLPPACPPLSLLKGLLSGLEDEGRAGEATISVPPMMPRPGWMASAL